LDSRKAIPGWLLQFVLPAWLDAPIVAFILTHSGFARGGGGGRTSHATFQELSRALPQLATTIEETPPLGRLKRQLRAMRRPHVYGATQVPLSPAPPRAN
jgi:hypothetical protein